MEGKEGLTVRELLENTYSRLCERHNAKEISLSRTALAEIADDSDWHRTRTGYICYKSANILHINDKTWAVARGVKGGSYPAEPYDSDIMALEFVVEEKTPEQIQEDLLEGIQRSVYFTNTLILGMMDSRLATSGKSSRFGKMMSELLKNDVSRFIAQEAEYDREYFSLSTLSPVCTSSVSYKPEFADFLTGTIETVLNGTK